LNYGAEDASVSAGQSVEAPSFKITGSLDVLFPGAEGAEEVTGTPVFSWVDDSGEDRYHIEVFDTFGEMIWNDPNIPKSTGSDPAVPYGGPRSESSAKFVEANRASSRCRFRPDLALARRAYSKGSMGVAELDPERGNINDGPVDGVLRRHRDS